MADLHISFTNIGQLPYGHFTYETTSPCPFTSSTLIGGEGEAGQSLLHTAFEGPMQYVNARWMLGLHGFLHGIK
jgi:hypothetical protein